MSQPQARKNTAAARREVGSALILDMTCTFPNAYCRRFDVPIGCVLWFIYELSGREVRLSRTEESLIGMRGIQAEGYIGGEFCHGGSIPGGGLQVCQPRRNGAEKCNCM